MRLNSITTKNYRTLQDITLDFSKNYCTVSGRNNAGKSCVIRLLSTLFRTSAVYPWMSRDSGFDYKEDKTQWVKQTVPIQIDYSLGITKEEDPALFTFIEKIASKKIEKPAAALCVSYTVSEGDDSSVTVAMDGERTDDEASKEIHKRIKDSNLLFLYNSTTPHEEFYFGQGRRRMFYEFVMSGKEKKALDEAGKHIERRLRRLAREHTQALSEILGRLNEKYDVEVSPPERYTTRQMALGINLRDRNVEVPLNDWGSGTQNRTHILMAILQANRIKTTGSPDEKITPFVVVEEPESFLHPSAQAEFGRLLRRLSSELGIQIITTTHSPYMLNQEEPASNILLARQVRRRKAYQTIVEDTSGESWMAPFSDHLGIGPEEFSGLRPLFSSYKSKVLLVEGSIDKEYFQCLQTHALQCERLRADIEIAPYGGKYILKNTLLIQFVLRQFDEAFVTYDLDGEGDVQTALARLGLKRNADYAPVGADQAGKDCIEGLLPERVLAAVNGRETNLVMKLGSKDSAERKDAKERLKQMYLHEFKAHSDYTREELRGLGNIVKLVNSRLGREQPSRPTAASATRGPVVIDS